MLRKKDINYSEFDEEPDEQQIEVKNDCDDLLTEDCVFQSFVQAITFSFFQKKLQQFSQS